MSARRPRVVWLVLPLLLAACDRDRRSAAQPHELAVDVLADTGRAQVLRIDPPDAPPTRAANPSPSPPAARVWLAQVAPARLELDQPRIPEPSPATLNEPGLPAPPALEIDDDLKPPILRNPGKLVLPPGARRGSVEIDVRVDEEGLVSDVMWVAGSEDSTLVAAALACAQEMRFFPALQSGRAVAVWCRQRFDVP